LGNGLSEISLVKAMHMVLENLWLIMVLFLFDPFIYELLTTPALKSWDILFRRF